MTRKGSMQLSIEAIIVLVIAIVLLGLGIGFIKNFFGEGSDALLGKFEPLKEECDVTASNPIIPKEVSLKQGETQAVKICVFNNQDSNVRNGVFKISQCVNPEGQTVPTTVPSTLPKGLAGDELKITSLGQNIDRGKTAGYKTTITTGGTTQAKLGTYICNVVVECDGTGSACTGSSKIGPVQMTFTVN